MLDSFAERVIQYAAFETVDDADTNLCHRAIKNRPLAGTSKPATSRRCFHIRFLDLGKRFSILRVGRLWQFVARDIKFRISR